MSGLSRIAVVLGIALASIPARSFSGEGGFAGVSQCFIGGKWVTVKGNCPAAAGGGGSSSGSGGGGGGAVYNGLYGASYQLGYAFGQWLFGSGSNPQAEQQKRLMMEELQRRQAEAERQHREEEARRLAAIYNRLSSTLKLSGVPNLQLKEVSGGSPGLKLKLGDSAEGHAGIKGLPGIHLNDGKTPYGIPGLPGIYTGGEDQGSGLTASGLKLKTGDGAGGNAPAGAAQAAPAAPVQPGPLPLPDPAAMTPQQMADVVEMVSRLPPEAQQEILAAGPLPGDAPAALQRQAAVSQVAASAATPEDASDKARAGFDRPIGQGPADRKGADPKPEIARPEAQAPRAPAAPGQLSAAVSTEAPAPQQPSEDLIKLYLFPGGLPPGPFPKNPDPPMSNPLRNDRSLKAELNTWDDWAMRQADYVLGKSNDPLYPAATERAILNAGAVKDYAPELFPRYESDPTFRLEVDRGLEVAAGTAVAHYYRGQAEAHKAALRSFHEDLGALAAAGKLDRLVPLEDQFRLHPERRQLVEEIRKRLEAEEAAAVEIAKAVGILRLKEEHRQLFQRLRAAASR
ncbi:MAG: hypothetical protein AB1346_02920 [Thermodesulfobacteriota bacterium]